MFCVCYEIGIGARSAGHASLFVPVFVQGCLNRRHNVKRVEKCASPFYELLRNLHQDFTSASTKTATIAERLRLCSPPCEILRQSQALRTLCTPPTNWLVQQAAVGDLLQTLKGLAKWRCDVFRPS